LELSYHLGEPEDEYFLSSVDSGYNSK
jgi:hypothetical protein